MVRVTTIYYNSRYQHKMIDMILKVRFFAIFHVISIVSWLMALQLKKLNVESTRKLRAPRDAFI